MVPDRKRIWVKTLKQWTKLSSLYPQGALKGFEEEENSRKQMQLVG